jgi:hypothetical protein
LAKGIEATGKISERQWVRPFSNTPEGLEAMEAHLHTSGAGTGASFPETSFVVDTTGVAKTGFDDGLTGVQLADPVDLATRLVGRIFDGGNPDEIEVLMAKLRELLP